MNGAKLFGVNELRSMSFLVRPTNFPRSPERMLAIIATSVAAAPLVIFAVRFFLRRRSTPKSTLLDVLFDDDLAMAFFQNAGLRATALCALTCRQVHTRVRELRRRRGYREVLHERLCQRYEENMRSVGPRPPKHSRRPRSPEISRRCGACACI